MSSKLFRCSILLLIVQVNCLYGQVTLRLRPDGANGKDAILADWTPNQNFGVHPEFGSIAWTCNGDPCIGRALIQFDLSSIPVGSTVNSASLSLFANPTPVNGNGIATQNANASWLERVTGNWDESTVTWSTAPLTTTVNRVMLAQSTSNFQDYVVDVRDMVQDMVNQPAQNNGFLIRLDDETYYTSMIFASSDFSDSLYWPMLEVVYTPAAAQQCQTVFVTDGNGQDAIVTTFEPALSYPNHEEFGSMSWTCNGDPCWQRGLMQFDLSFIPSNAVVDSAFLDLHANPTGQAVPPMQGANASYLKRITSPWSANSVTWNTQPATTTQNQVLLPTSPTGNTDYLQWNVLSLVQDMVANASTSYGFEIEMIDTIYYKSMLFASSDYPDNALHPSLRVCYRSTISVDELSGSVRSLELFPNPTSTSVTLNLRLVAPSSLDVIIYDMQGRAFYRESFGRLGFGEHRLFLNLRDGDLSNGLYLVRVQSQDRVITRKLLVRR